MDRNFPYVQLMLLSLLLLLSSGCSRGDEELEVEIVHSSLPDVYQMSDIEWSNFKDKAILGSESFDVSPPTEGEKMPVVVEELTPPARSSRLFSHHKSITPSEVKEVKNEAEEKVERFSQKTIKPKVHTATNKKHRLPPNALNATKEVSFVWPLKGEVVVPFGAPTNGSTNNGINIEGKSGGIVKSVESGKVLHVGSIKQIGKIILIEHPQKIISVYSHIKNVKVKKGEIVKKGAIIANVLDNIRNKGELHFELRKNGVGQDPSELLP